MPYKCNKCGATVPENATICAYCGNAVTPTQPTNSIYMNYQTGVFKTVATYQSRSSLPETINALCNAIATCKYKLIQQTPNMVKFQTPVTFWDWGFNMTAILNQTEGGTFVRIEGKPVVPFSPDILRVCKKKITTIAKYL